MGLNQSKRKRSLRAASQKEYFFKREYFSNVGCIKFITFFLLSLFIFSAPLTVSAKSYTFDRLSIEAEVLEDGGVLIEEIRTYTFRGSFSWADYKLPLQGEQ